MPKVTMIPVDHIDFDPDYYPRASGCTDWITVHVYRQALQTNPWKADHKRKDAFPPITVVRATGFRTPYLGLDGLHRTEAWEGEKLKRIPAFVENIPQSMWLKRAAELNLAGQKPLTGSDKARLAVKFKEAGWTKEKISGFLCIRMDSFEREFMNCYTKVSAKNAKTIPPGRGNQLIGRQRLGFLKAPFRGAADTLTALQIQGPVAAMNVHQIVDSFLAVLQSGSIDVADTDLHEKLDLVQELLDEYLG